MAVKEERRARVQKIMGGAWMAIPSEDAKDFKEIGLPVQAYDISSMALQRTIDGL